MDQSRWALTFMIGEVTGMAVILALATRTYWLALAASLVGSLTSFGIEMWRSNRRRHGGF